MHISTVQRINIFASQKTDYATKQANELKSLEGGWWSLMRDKDDPDTKFMIKLLPHDDSDESNHVGIRLYVSYPPKYPDEIAKFRVEVIKGLKDKQVLPLWIESIEWTQSIETL